MRAAALIVVAACSSSPQAMTADAGAVDSPSADAAVLSTTAIGVLIQGAYAAPPPLPYTGNEGIPTLFAQDERLRIATDLHAVIERTQVRFLAPGMASGVDFAMQIEAAGLRLALTTLPNPMNTQGATPPLADADVPAFKTNLDTTLARLQPAVLMVENEEIAPNFYSGTPDTYAIELAAAVEVAHARGIPVTNGGLTNVPCRLLTWYAFYQHADFTHADAFADLAFNNPNWRQTFPSASNPALAIPTASQNQIDRGLAYMAVYTASAMDYMNVHLYELDPQAMRQIVDYIAGVSGKPVMTGEMGQYDELGSTVSSMLGVAVEKQFPFVIWYSGDGNPAVSLVSSNGAEAYSMRAGGSAFAAFNAAAGH